MNRNAVIQEAIETVKAAIETNCSNHTPFCGACVSCGEHINYEVIPDIDTLLEDLEKLKDGKEIYTEEQDHWANQMLVWVTCLSELSGLLTTARNNRDFGILYDATKQARTDADNKFKHAQTKFCELGGVDIAFHNVGIK